MIVPWNKVKVEHNGETIEFQIQQTGIDGRCYASPSPIPNEFIVIIDDNFGNLTNIFSDGARLEFHDMSILAAIAGKLHPTDSLAALRATQRMRCTMHREEGTSNVIVNL